MGSGGGDGPVLPSGVVGTVPDCPSMALGAFKPSPGGSWEMLNISRTSDEDLPRTILAMVLQPTASKVFIPR